MDFSQDKTLAEIVDRISQKVNPTKICLFGSRARGDHHPESDYDFTLIYDGEKFKRDVKIEARRSCRCIDASMDIPVLTSDELRRYYRSSIHSNAKLPKMESLSMGSK